MTHWICVTDRRNRPAVRAGRFDGTTPLLELRLADAIRSSQVCSLPSRRSALYRTGGNSGKPMGVTMPCGWGCGEQLTARTIRGHFTSCAARPGKDPDRPEPRGSLKRESPASIAAALIARAKQIRPAASPELSGAPARTPYPPASVTDQDLNGDAGEHRKLVAFDDL